MSALLAAPLSVLVAAPSTASAAPLVSSNWSGYAARASSRRLPFQSVSGQWRQPAAVCRSGRESYAGVWVGLGGYSERSRALEQIGTDSDCTRGGRGIYATWYELVPARPVQIPIAIAAGDEISASVTVRRHDVMLRLRDLTNGKHFSALRRTPAIDVSSAEWIVEAPSSCLDGSACTTLPLTDFGTTTFTSATATAAGRTADAAGPGWSTAALELRQSSRAASISGRGVQTAVVAAVPSPLSAGGSFSVEWAEERPSAEAAPVASTSALDTVRFPGLAGIAQTAVPR